MFAMINCGAAYTLAIGAMSPVIASLLGVLFLKEKTNLRFWLGLVCVVAGGIITSYVAPDGEQYPNFYFGIILAFASAVGWGLEGLTGTLGTDAVDSEVGVGIRYLCSACVYFLFILVIGGFDFLYDCIFVHPQGFVYVLIACIIGAIGVMYWYVSFNMTGCTRAMAINSTYGLWNIFYSLILSAFGIFEVAINSNLVIGSIMIVAGIFLVLANPRDLLELRKS